MCPDSLASLHNRSTVVIGISGPSGAGKSTLSRCLEMKLRNCRILQQDLYFIDPDLCSDDANFCDLRYLHVNEFVGHVSMLLANQSVAVPVIDFLTFRRTGRTRIITPGDYLISEGMTIFRIPEILSICDFRFYLTPSIKRIRDQIWNRNPIERGKSSEVVKKQLKWIENEYQNDLTWFANQVTFIRNLDSAEITCGMILQHIDHAKRLNE